WPSVLARRLAVACLSSGRISYGHVTFAGWNWGSRNSINSHRRTLVATAVTLARTGPAMWPRPFGSANPPNLDEFRLGVRLLRRAHNAHQSLAVRRRGCHWRDRRQFRWHHDFSGGTL